MTDKKIMKLQIISALISAGLILVSSWVFLDSEFAQSISLIIFVFGWIAFSTYLNTKISKKEEDKK